MKNISMKITACTLITTLLLSGCASIVSKSTYPLAITSSPSNARISIVDKKNKEIYLGNTPATVKLKAGAGFFQKQEYRVKFSSPGYDDKIVPVTFKLDAWYFGNIVFGGFIGLLIVDPATGAMWKIERKFLNETLIKTTVELEPSMQIMNINQIPASWRAHLERIN